MRAEQQQLLQIANRAMARVPASRLAADQPYRLADVAVDHAQDVGPLPAAAVTILLETFRAAGAHAHASSIHVNAWFGEHDKASAAQQLLTQEYGLSAARQQQHTLFIGDAPNDETMFRTFALSVGVANLRPHLPQLTHRPRSQCEAPHCDVTVAMARPLR